MAIHKKNGKYVPIVYLGKDPLTGKEIRKWGSYHEKKKDAEKEHAQMVLEKENLKKGNIFKETTFEFLANEFFKLVAPKKYTKYTLEQHMYNYKRHIEPIFNSKLLSDIEPIHIQKFMNTKEYLSPATQRKIFYFLKVIMDKGVSWNMIRINPCIGIELSKVERKKDHITWTTEQIKMFLDYNLVKNSKWYVPILLSVSTGMRPGEVCGSKWKNLEGKTLNVLTGIDKKRRDTDLKNDNSFNRKLYLDENLISALNKQRKWQAENKLLFGQDYISSSFMFTHENGRVINPDNYGKTFKKLIKSYNIDNDIPLPEITLYDTRHSFATNSIALGVEPSVVAYIMGHSSTQTTYDNYVHTREDSIKKGLKTLAELIR